jgi:hypothetical protein
VLNGITGSIGLGPTLAALEVGNKLALANKESLVAAGELVMSKAAENQLIPVDSEHSAIWQSAMAGKKSEIAKLVLTASGGPFRNRRDLSDVTISDALAHPTWAMGQVVTINSATLMNKSLEIIEAHYLFDLPYRQIEAVIHPQSIVHSMVEYVDGSTLAQLSPPNMKGPIAYAINWPTRLPAAPVVVLNINRSFSQTIPRSLHNFSKMIFISSNDLSAISSILSRKVAIGFLALVPGAILTCIDKFNVSEGFTVVVVVMLLSSKSASFAGRNPKNSPSSPMALLSLLFRGRSIPLSSPPPTL